MKDSQLLLNGLPIDGYSPRWGNNRAFLYGESIFTTMKVVNQRIMFLDDHLNRLCSQFFNFFLANIFHESEIEQLEKLIKEDLEKFSLGASQKIRITLFFESDELSLENLQRLVSIDPYTEDLKLVSAKTIQLPDDRLRNIKLGNYSKVFFYKRQLVEPYNDLCIINQENNILELSTSNVFFFKNETLYFPKNDENYLPGITMKHVKNALQERYSIKEKSINLNDLESFEGAFACSSLRYIRGIQRIDEYKFNNSCFDSIQKLWSKYVQ